MDDFLLLDDDDPSSTTLSRPSVSVVDMSALNQINAQNEDALDRLEILDEAFTVIKGV